MNSKIIKTMTSVELSKLVADGIEELNSRSMFNDSYSRLAMSLGNNAMKNAALAAAGLTLNKPGIADDEPVGFLS